MQKLKGPLPPPHTHIPLHHHAEVSELSLSEVISVWPGVGQNRTAWLTYFVKSFISDFCLAGSWSFILFRIVLKHQFTWAITVNQSLAFDYFDDFCFAPMIWPSRLMFVVVVVCFKSGINRSDESPWHQQVLTSRAFLVLTRVIDDFFENLCLLFVCFDVYVCRV